MKDAVTFAEGRNQPCRNGAIDFLRFVGINCIVFLHFQQFTEADYFPIDFFGGGMILQHSLNCFSPYLAFARCITLINCVVISSIFRCC